MKTYQDLLEFGKSDEGKIAFIQAAISDHKTSDIYRFAADAEEYDRQNNVTIMTYQKYLYKVSGEVVVDRYSPNHKICSNFFNFFVTQENQYLLSNGITLGDKKNKELLGKDFDRKLQEMGRNALVQGVSFGFWNLTHLEVFKLTEFVPLYDEETSMLMGGIRFFQIDGDKPLRATLYEIDGYTEYIQENGGDMKVHKPKQKYIKVTTENGVDGEEIKEWKNYPGFPIIPMWGNPHHESELNGLRAAIDAYDLIDSGFVNDLDGALIYWILKNSAGMDDVDIAQFMDRLRSMGVVFAEDAEDINAKEVAVPYEARGALLDRLESDMYRDQQALDVTSISGGNKTATEINAAYQPLDNKVDQYEYCVLDFIEGLFAIVGIDDSASFTRNKIASRSDDMQTLMMGANYLSDEYMVRKICSILGDPDAAEEILKQKANDDVDRLLGGEPDEDGSGASDDRGPAEETGEEDQ